MSATPDGRLRGLGAAPRANPKMSQATPRTDPTTVIMFGVPRDLRLREVTALIDAMGFRGGYDFASLMMNGKSPRAAAQSGGYGFVNFRDPLAAARFLAATSGREPRGAAVPGLGSEPARVQGFMACTDALRRSIRRGKLKQDFVCRL
uniref:RRM domain-containing protein n=1 Tax=Alexandrium monilatum TaxID=311494 RepID=A0A7S4UW55_9DINO|mmetsp:Transcript_106637/g.318749  ORF Transcript_106637/g.318749 Transcript_106637/m.318749 type:complete len:148 (+) Transcript_106637:54-497(+)